MVDLKTIQSMELDIMKYIDRICRENNIIYYLGFGTLIGAIRHKGFIPWDDDIDILMPRDDYERFSKYCKENCDSRYHFCDIETEEKWTAPLAKVIDTKTILNQVGHKEKMNLGLYVDVFAMDGVPSAVKERDRWFRKLDFLQKLWSGCEYEKRPAVNVINIIKNVITILLNLITSGRRISILIDNEVKKYSYNECSIVGPNTYVVYPRNKMCINKDVFGKGCDVEFEGAMFRAPSKYDEYLRAIYGDYMKLPPEDKRIAHHNYSLEILE